jgi:peptidoglycan hydrolase-like protein with peptidoglycan-binding domain
MKKRYKSFPAPLALAALLLLAACGSTTEDRTLSGAGIGAAAGAGVGAVTGLSILEGAAIGAVVGGATGALTDESEVNLGTPIWKDGAKSGLVRDTQVGLNRLGYDAGPADGVMGPRTRQAIRTFQANNGLPVDGRPSEALLEEINRQQG